MWWLEFLDMDFDKWMEFNKIYLFLFSLILWYIIFSLSVILPSMVKYVRYCLMYAEINWGNKR